MSPRLANGHGYGYYKQVFAGRLMPFAFVDLDLFDANLEAIRVRAGKKPICVASKSVRCAALLKRIQSASPQYHSIMAYSAREAVFLAERGFDNILVAYPVLREAQTPELAEALRKGKTITLMVDCREQVEHLDTIAAAAGVTIPLCMDLDMSGRYPGVYFGVRRSSIRTPEQALALWADIRPCRHVTLTGVMGYEAQIAGLQDHAPGSFLKNRLIHFLKKRSIPEVVERRAAIVLALRRAGCELQFVNGGGTGSVETTRCEDVVTEVTVGSGFYSPTLFDHYTQFKHLPAVGYAIEIVRRPEPTIYTCQGGGYIASGAAGPDKLPQPYLPEDARLIAQEGAGEVQTPVVYNGPEALKLGDPVFMRHAKAGELCERFNSLLLISDGRVVDEVATYRGEGLCFL
ncbi:MAG: hypothetical protein QG656_2140 [Candidatus Hydrogenedentes bacterium]|nr:hypothetical protein [Candidatus Hydrogenedentota bacterium]